MSAEPAVVADVHHIVELSPLADGSDPHGGAVDAGVGADLHVVADFHPSDLGEFLPAVLLHHIPEAVGADYYAGMQNHTAPDVAIVVNGDMRVEHAAFADGHALADHRTGANRTGDTEPGAGADHRVGADESHRAEIDVLGDDGRGMNSRFEFGSGIKAVQRTRESGARLRDADDGAPGRTGPLERDQKAPGSGRLGLLGGFPRGSESNVRSAGGFERGHAGKFLFSVAFESSAQPVSQFANAHGLMIHEGYAASGILLPCLCLRIGEDPENRLTRLKPHILSLGTTIVVVAAIGILSYSDWTAADALVASADQARAVADLTSQLLSSVKDAETGQRGYLLTGDDEYLKPYLAALPRVEGELQRLTEATSGDPDASTAAALKALVDEKLAELAHTVQLRQAGKTAEAMAMVRTNIGKASMEKIREQGDALIHAENNQLRSQLDQSRAHRMRTRVVVLGGTAVLALLLLGAVFHVSSLITTLERAHATEHTQKATLRTTIESIGDAVIATDTAGNITFLNPVAERATGWPMSEAVGRPLSEVFKIISEDSRESVENPADKVLRMGAVVGLANHTLLIRRDGREVPVDDSGAPIRDAQGKVNGVVLVFRDVTARRETEREIAESGRRYQLLFNANPQPMWVFDQKTLQFLAVNNAAVNSYGYSREEFLRMRISDIRPQEDVPRLLDSVASAGGGLNTDGPWRHRKKDGTVILVEITSHLLDFDGREACIVLASDVTERKRLEEQVQQSQKLESIGRLAGGVAHDFNNLLTVINGYSEMLLADVPEDSPFRDSLHEIRAAGERASALTQQLLAFSRKQIVKPSVINLNLVAGDIRKMLRRLIPENIELATRLSPDLGNITADPGQLQQVIMNLAVNARDAMPAGGTLVIETANVEFDEAYASTHAETRPGPHVMLAVSDTGTGMSPEVKSRIFEPFFTTKPTGSGTGLGLATVYGMVKQAGGWIWVYSEPGRGSTFKVYFPRTDLPVSATSAPVKRATGGTETILVVEDQPEVLTFVVTALKPLGYTVYSASDGSEALAFARQFKGKIDLLLSDVIMPGGTGREMADKLRRDRPDLRVLFMSGYTADAIAHHGVLDAGIDYLQKPFTPDLLATRIREVLTAPRPPERPTILVVDDEEGILKLLHTLLSQAGYAVIDASNGEAALAKLNGPNRIDLVITDLVMPQKEGLELIRGLHASRPDLKVVAISGAFGGDFLEAAKMLGAQATLRKPIEKDLLLQTVRTVLANGQRA